MSADELNSDVHTMAMELLRLMLYGLDDSSVISTPTQFGSSMPPSRHALERLQRWGLVVSSPPHAPTLTLRGNDLVMTLLRAAAQELSEQLGCSHQRPYWDRASRELRFRNAVVKRFRKAAPNQELILDSFEELGWSHRIDDPLSHKDEIVPPVRLRDAIKRLNGKMENPLIRFGGDGRGKGVIWSAT